MKLEFDVLPEDIKKAKKIRKDFQDHKTFTYKRSDSCPIACAIKRIFGIKASILPTTVVINDTVYECTGHELTLLYFDNPKIKHRKRKVFLELTKFRPLK